MRVRARAVCRRTRLVRLRGTAVPDWPCAKECEIDSPCNLSLSFYLLSSIISYGNINTYSYIATRI